MPDGRLMRAKVIDYLGSLSPGARLMLLRKLEIAGEAGQLDASTRLILEATRAVVNGTKSDEPRPARVRRLFFEPFAPFIIREELRTRQTGRLSIDSIDGIWTYLVRDVAPDLFGPWLDEASIRVYSPEADLKVMMAELRDTGLRQLRANHDELSATAKGRQRLGGLIGGERALSDLGDLFAIHERRKSIATLVHELPATIVVGDPSETTALEVVGRFVERVPADAVWAGCVLLSRLASPAVLARIAVALGGGDKAGDIRRSSVASFLDIYFSEAERVIVRFGAARRRPDGTAEMARALGSFHDLVRSISISIDFDGDSAWRKRLGDLRRSMSDMVQAEVEAIVPTIRRALRVEGGSTAGREGEGQDAIRAMTVLAEARRCRDSLAINELLAQVGQSSEQAIEVLGNRAIEQLKKTAGAGRADVLMAVDIMIKLAELAFGPEYAVVMRKARDRAVGRTGAALATG
ncbi:hypothetical protein [Methylobrevis albus]|uniref:Uncharacterized protein n=1 Tax=Methylobrevis albus TaxID=2793297 RepID=A0A931MWQ4_9HYPH|nr:hypothetical protein [Methylobrevis albus]MBH0237593.1 hypothetical protein [Methylobrevis albus]